MPCGGGKIFLSFAQQLTGSGKDRPTQRGRSRPLLRVLLHMRMDMAQLSGEQTGRRCWKLLLRVWRVVAPLMTPWCAEGMCPLLRT